MNKFDEIAIDLEDLYRSVKSIEPVSARRSLPASCNVISMYWQGLLVKTGIRQRFMYAGFVQRWFSEFLVFWRRYLKGRPIDILDFHYLRMSFRSKYQHVQHQNENDAVEYLNAWNRPENLYLLLSAVWNYNKVNFLGFHYLLKYLPRRGKIVEYGCGVAPVTQGLIRFLPHRKYQFVICDILQINFIYAIYSLAKEPNVTHTLLSPYGNVVEGNGVNDAIICVTVLEHIPNPLEVVKSFHQSLRAGGRLIFDYILSEGAGLDSVRSRDERNSVLDFIEQHFTMIHGTINRTGDMGFSVAEKPPQKT